MALISIILDSRKITYEFRECQVTQIFWEANEAAGFLAKMGRDQVAQENGCCFWSQPPRGLLNILEVEAFGRAMGLRAGLLTRFRSGSPLPAGPASSNRADETGSTIALKGPGCKWLSSDGPDHFFPRCIYNFP